MWKKVLTVLVVVPMLVWVLTGCGSTTKASSQPSSTGGSTSSSQTDSNKPVNGDLPPLKKPATVTIAEDGSASGAGFYIATEKGYFKQYNINVKYATFQNSDDMLPALASGKVDVAGGISSASFFNSIAQGIDVKMIADKGHNIPGKSYFSFVIRKNEQNTIKSYKDLKGKKIAVSTRNGVDDYIFQQMLNSAGLKRSDVHFVLMPDFSNMLAALSNGTVDAALEIEPIITKGISEGICVRLGDTTDYAPKAQIAMVLGSPVFLNQRSDVAQRFMLAYLKGVRDYNDAFVKNKGNKQEIIKIMTKYTALKDPKIWQQVDVTGLNPDGKMFVNDIKKQYEWYKSNGAVQGTVNMSQAIDTSLTQKAVQILGPYNQGN